MAALRKLADRAPVVVALVPLLLLWEMAGRLEWFPSFPSITRIAVAWFRFLGQPDFQRNFLLSVREVALGFGLAILCGIALGLLMGLFRPVEYFCDMYVNLFLAAPMSALVPVLILLFGLGEESIIATVFFFSFFIIVVNTLSGVRQVDRRLLEMARSFGAPPGIVLRRVIIPSALPMILAGFRLGIGRAINGFVIGEMLIAVVGIGGMIMFYGGAFLIAELYALVFTVIGMGLCVMLGAVWLERRLTPWLRERRGV